MMGNVKVPWLLPDEEFPDVSQSSTEKGIEGLLAISREMTPAQLVRAYRHGIFPWYSEGYPVMWWSTSPRMVLPTDRFIISHSLRKKLKQVHRSMHSNGPWQVRFDSAFDEVILCCAYTERTGQDGTWITGDIISNYSELHRQGIAHSAEVFFEGQLVGGAYGINLGKMFFGESMFAHRTDASKIALAYLTAHLKQQDVQLIDCQQETPHLASLGAGTISREAFSAHLDQVCDQPAVTGWHQPDCPFCSLLSPIQ